MNYGRRGRCLPLLAALALGVAGCGKGGGAGSSASLRIESPHGPEIRAEFERVFKQQHPEASLEWLDQGGTTDDLRFVLSEFAGKKQGIGVDVFFGGGAEVFLELEDSHCLQPQPSAYGVPAALNGVPLRGSGNSWVAAALSGFGILYNKTFATRDALPIPTSWAGLGEAKLQGRVGLADPRHSGSAHEAFEIVLQTNGWDRGWQILTAMAGNARSFEASSSHLTENVQSGEAVMTPCIDFYARNAISRAGSDKLGYVEPPGQRVVTPDPIGILVGAPHAALARQFVDFVMSPAGQKLWYLKKGAKEGPVQAELNRLPAVPSLYQPLSHDSLIHDNPYAMHNTHQYDAAKARQRRRVLDDLISATLIDNHNALKQAWARTPDAARLGSAPVSEDAVLKLVDRWNEGVFRQTHIGEWQQAARKRFGG